MEGFFITRISRMMGMNNRELNIRTTMITNLRGLIRANPCNPWQELSYEILLCGVVRAKRLDCRRPPFFIFSTPQFFRLFIILYVAVPGIAV